MTRKRRRIVLIGTGVAFGLFIVAGIVFVAPWNIPMLPASQPITLQGGNVRGTNHMIATRSWSLSYDRGEFSPDGTTGTIDGVHNGIIYRKGKPYVEIAARHIALDTETLDFTAIGVVHIQMLDDPYRRSFDTDYVTWTNDAKLLRMDHPSFLHVGGQTLKIRSIAIDFDKNEIHLGRIDGAVGIP